MDPYKPKFQYTISEEIGSLKYTEILEVIDYNTITDNSEST